MSGFSADHRVVGAGQGLQAKTIGSGAVEDDKNFDIGTKIPLEFANGGLGAGVVAIAHGVTLIGRRDRL